MKKTVLALILVLAAAPLSAAEKNRADLTVIRKAVLDGPVAGPAAESHWFKLVVTDTRRNREIVKISLPIGLCELFLRKCGDTKVRMENHLADIDLAEIWAELKRSLPRTVIEVSGPKETIKIWFE
jgi:hypothetical protein